MIRILLLEHLGGTELAAEALKVHIARFLPARRPLRAPVPERRFTPPAKRKSDLAPSLKKSSPSLLSRFAGASQRAMPAHGGATGRWLLRFKKPFTQFNAESALN